MQSQYGFLEYLGSFIQNAAVRTFVAIVIAVLAALAMIAYRHAIKSAPASPNLPTNSNQKVYFAKGILKEILPGGQVVKIQHEAIPGYMTAMTMPFEVKDTNELTGLKTGPTFARQTTREFLLRLLDQLPWFDRSHFIRAAAPAEPV
jgi:protein SCO1/2